MIALRDGRIVVIASSRMAPFRTVAVRSVGHAQRQVGVL